MKEVPIDSLRKKHKNLDNAIARLEDSNYELRKKLDRAEAALRVEKFQNNHLKERIIQDDLDFECRAERWFHNG
jgi:predicted RNase H-like nuclease (RuvC/YqgF family)